MTWGMARRPKISNKLGSPDPREGSDGDIQVRQTSLGARIFAKLGGRWFSNKLFGSEIDDPAVSIPKCWHIDVDNLPNTDSTSNITKLPGYITKENVLGGTAIIYTTSFWTITPLNYANTSTSYECVFFISTTSGDNMLRCSQLGTSVRNQPARITIFFK
jgi:hypothetical protein